VLPEPAPLGGALVEETALLVRWLAVPGTRIVRTSDGWASPAHAAGRWAGWAATARSARLAAEQVTEPDYADLLAPVRRRLRASG
jgi:DNA polymerase-3 subunit epsilon